MLAALLSRVNQPTPEAVRELCPESVEACRQGKDLIDAFALVASKIEGPKIANDVGVELGDLLADQRRATTLLDEMRSTVAAPEDLSDCAGRSYGKPNDDDFGPPLCTATERRTFLFVPSLVGLRPGSSWNAPIPTDARAVRIKEAIVASSVLKPLASAFLLPDACNPPTASRSVVAAYFISPDSVMRFWRCSREAPDFPATKLWASAQYMVDLLQRKTGSDRYDSAVYVDYAGSGLVHTRCKRVVQGSKMIGVVCVDNLVPTSMLSDGPQNEMVVTEQISYQLRAGGDLGMVQNRDSRIGHSAEQVRQALERVLQLAPATLTGSVTRIDVGGDVAFLVPAGADGTDTKHAFIVTPKVTFPPSVWWFAIGAAWCIFLALVFFVLGIRLSRAANEGSVLADLLKNLEIGICISDSGDCIESVNDRAEQVLGVSLPKIGESLRVSTGLESATTTRPVALRDIIGTGPFYEVADDERLMRRDATYIREQRRNGDSSTYYAELLEGKYKGDYVLISAAPIRLGDTGSSEDPRTFGVIQRMSGSRRERVRRRIERNDALDREGVRPDKSAVWDKVKAECSALARQPDEGRREDQVKLVLSAIEEWDSAPPAALPSTNTATRA